MLETDHDITIMTASKITMTTMTNTIIHIVQGLSDILTLAVVEILTMMTTASDTEMPGTIEAGTMTITMTVLIIAEVKMRRGPNQGNSPHVPRMKAYVLNGKIRSRKAHHRNRTIPEFREFRT